MSWPHARTLLFLFLLTLPLCHWPVHAQEEPIEDDRAMAAYADAANFQTGGAIDLAIEAWHEYLREFPDHSMFAQASHYLGVCYMQKEEPDLVAATEAFDRALQNEDYDLREESLANHGWCLFASAGVGQQQDPGRLKRAIATFAKLQEEFPGSRFLDRAVYYSGESAFGLGQAETAIEFYNQLLSMPSAKDSPLRCDALYSRGVALEELDQLDEALASFNQLIASCDDSDLATGAQLRMGDLRILRREFDEAIDAFEVGFGKSESDEEKSYALFRQAYALVQSGRPAEAAEKYEQIQSNYPESKYAASAVLASAQSVYRSGDIDEAAIRFEKVLDGNNSAAATEAAHWLARIQISKSRPGDAIRIIRAQIDRGLEGAFAPELRLDLAEALSLDPETIAESLQAFEQVYRAGPDDPVAPRALYNAAFSALQIKQNEKALELALEFLGKFPNDTLTPDVIFIAAESELATGNPKAAANRYKKLVNSTDPDNIQRSYWLLRTAMTCNVAQQYDDTIEILSREIDNFATPEQKAEALYLVGRAHLSADRPADAINALQACRETNSSWRGILQAALLEGDALLASGEIADAQATWLQLVKSNPNTFPANQGLYKLAQSASDDGSYELASRYYERILESENAGRLIPLAQYGKGWALMQLARFDEALAPLQEMLASGRQHPLKNDALLARGIVLRNLGKKDEARDDLQEFLSTEPAGHNLGHALYELALIDQEEKQPGKAAQKLERLVKDIPDYPSMDKVRYELGWSLNENGEVDAAVEHFSQLISKYPSSSVISDAAYFLGQQEYAVANWTQAAQHFELAATRAKDSSLSEKAYYRSGWSYFKAQQFEKAESLFASLAKEFPEGRLSLDALTMVGECRFKRTDFEEALAGYELARQVVRINNDTSESVRDSAERQVRELTYLHGGQSAAQLKRWDDAIEWHNEHRERFPASRYLSQVFYETGFAYQQKGDAENAMKFFGEVADNYRNELAARARFMMGEVHFANRQFDKAIPEFQRVMFGFGSDKASDRIKNWQAKSGFEAARCSEVLMRSARSDANKETAQKISIRFYTYVVEKHPEHELANRARQRLEALQ